MTQAAGTPLKTGLLWAILLVYTLGRLCQVYSDRLPVLLIVILHVVPPAVFALVHGSVLYRVKGILVFSTLCFGVGTFFESLSLRTGFPFGHYYFTNAMGPKVFELPVLLVLAYLGIGYTSWVLAVIVAGSTDRTFSGGHVFTVPLLASFIMVAWDLAMDPGWSTLDHVWIWRDGGAYFGVPVSNFLGWFLTVYVFYQLFAVYLTRQPAVALPESRSFWRVAVLFYAVCAAGNLLLGVGHSASALVPDASGRQWPASDVVEVCALVSIFVMGPFALIAWVRSGSYRG